MAVLETSIQSVGPIITGLAAVYAAVYARKASHQTNSVEGKSAAKLSQEARDEAIHARRAIELHNADTKRHLF